MPTNISWTDETWNPVTGCTPISEGCANCYDRDVAHSRLRDKYVDGFGVITEHENRLLNPIVWAKKPRKIFVGSMTDLFHDQVSDEFLEKILNVIKSNPQHVFQLLTKRACNLNRIKNYPHNVWLGVTIENNRNLIRLEYLTKTNAKVKFVSAEPLLEPFSDLTWLRDVDWIIVGGESGPRYRPFNSEWARQIREMCRNYGTAFWFKQAAGIKPRKTLDGQTVQEWPSCWPKKPQLDLF